MSGVHTAFLCDEDEMEEIIAFEKKDKRHLYGMKVLNVLKSFSRHLSFDKHKQYQQIKSYKKLLKKLDEKEIYLNKKLKNENNENNCKTLKMRLTVNCVQRKKAVAAINKLKSNI